MPLDLKLFYVVTLAVGVEAGSVALAPTPPVIATAAVVTCLFLHQFAVVATRELRHATLRLDMRPSLARNPVAVVMDEMGLDLGNEEDVAKAHRLLTRLLDPNGDLDGS